MEVVRHYKGADLGYVQVKDIGPVAAIRYDDGAEFTTDDWQGPQPDMTDLDDIARFRWVDLAGTPAVMIGGLPRIIC